MILPYKGSSITMGGDKNTGEKISQPVFHGNIGNWQVIYIVFILWFSTEVSCFFKANQTNKEKRQTALNICWLLRFTEYRLI